MDPGVKADVGNQLKDDQRRRRGEATLRFCILCGTERSPMKRVPAVFFRTAAGHEPVREWLKAMERDDRRRIGEALKVVEFGWPVGMPVCRSLGGGLHEVRADLAGRRTARVFFYIDRMQRLVVLHGILKKTRTTPAADLAVARTNMSKHKRSLT